jgi:hypothetical protein
MVNEEIETMDTTTTTTTRSSRRELELASGMRDALLWLGARVDLSARRNAG